MGQQLDDTIKAAKYWSPGGKRGPSGPVFAGDQMLEDSRFRALTSPHLNQTSGVFPTIISLAGDAHISPPKISLVRFQCSFSRGIQDGVDRSCLYT
jgi:hypothetical protein